MRLPIHYLRTAKFYLQGKYRAYKLPANIVSNARGKVVVCYHGIDYKNNTSVNTKFRGAAHFEEEIMLLSQFTNIISLPDYVKDNINPDKLNVAITFDDGFMNNYTLAKPILEKYKAPATFFITPIWHQQKDILWPDLLDYTLFYVPATLNVADEQYHRDILGRYFHTSGLPIRLHIIRQSHDFLDELYSALAPFAHFRNNTEMGVYWKLMGDNEVRELANNPLFTIGSHSLTHTNLCYIDDKDALDELTESKRMLETITQKNIDFFAAPFGTYDGRTVGLTKQAGYKYQVMASLQDAKYEQQPDIIPRFITNPYLSPALQLLFIANKKF